MPPASNVKLDPQSLLDLLVQVREQFDWSAFLGALAGAFAAVLVSKALSQTLRIAYLVASATAVLAVATALLELARTHLGLDLDLDFLSPDPLLWIASLRRETPITPTPIPVA